MSNRAYKRAYIEATKFENPQTGDITYGVRVYDDYDRDYCDIWESVPRDDLDLLAEVVSYQVGVGIISYVVENRRGVTVNGSWYDWDEIKDIVSKW